MDGRLVLANGTILDDSYRVERVIGSGGFGITYAAQDMHLGSMVAIKEYYPDEFGDRDANLRVHPKSARHKEIFDWGRSSFLQEAHTLVRFRHPSIVRVARVFEAHSTAYMVMDYEQGLSFEAWLKALSRPPTQEELDWIAGPLLDALETIHAQHFLHRDIAPDNIIVRADGRPVLLDFGAARMAIAEKSRSLTGIVKAGYSPPEQYMTDSRLQGPWSDVYAMSATLYRAVTGLPPEEATLRIIDDHIPSAAQAAKAIYRRGFLAAIDAGLRVRPGERPQSMSQFRDMLLSEGALHTSETRIAAESRNSTRQILAQPSQRPQWSRITFVIALLVATVGSFAALQSQSRRAIDIRSSRQQQDENQRLVDSEAALRKLNEEAVAQEKLRTEQRQREEEKKRQTAIAPVPVAACGGGIEITVGNDDWRCLQPGSGASFRDCPTCPEMVVVPAGHFSMGSPKDEPEREGVYQGSEDQVGVTIAQPFAVGRFAVTRGEFSKFVATTGHNMDGGCAVYAQAYAKQPTLRWQKASWQLVEFAQDDHHPVVCVNWNDANAYVRWLSITTGKAYRLLSEAEREYSARAGSITPFWWGSQISVQQANYVGLSTYNGGTKGIWRKTTVPVDGFTPNAWGLYNVHGNVAEWVDDCWNFTHQTNPGNGTARNTGDCNLRPLRGGSWSDNAIGLRSAARNPAHPEHRSHNIGFRVARTLDARARDVPR